MLKKTITSQQLIFGVALYFATVLNMSLWRFIRNSVEIHGVSDVVFAVSLPVFVFLILFVTFNLLLIKYLTKPILLLLLILSAVANYAMWTYGIVIDSDMYQNVIETDYYEIYSLVTFKSLLWVFLAGVLPFLFICPMKIVYTSLSGEIRRRTFYVLGSLLILLCFAGVSYKEYASFGRNHNEARKLLNPLNYIYAFGRYSYKESVKNQKFHILDESPVIVQKEDDKPNLIVVMIGETARSADFSLYGYERRTNPKLEQREDLIVWNNVSSCGTSTAVSVPCLFSASTRSTFNTSTAKRTQNLVDIAQKAGYDVLWLDNDGGCKGVCDRVPTEDVRQIKDERLCSNGSCYDAILLGRLEKKLRNLDRNTLIVLHMMGSHGPTYFERYPERFKKFRPTCDTADLQNCTREEIVNTYDNTILYTDHVVNRVIQKLEDRTDYRRVLMYVSDHGESLGENRLYLHGFPYALAPAVQKTVPMLMWIPQEEPAMQALRASVRNPSVSHDNIFHTLLGLMDIRSETYDPALDMSARFEKNVATAL